MDGPHRFDEFERLRYEIIHACARAQIDDPVHELLHEANDLATAAYAWPVLAHKEKRSIQIRIERLIEAWSARTY